MLACDLSRLVVKGPYCSQNIEISNSIFDNWHKPNKIQNFYLVYILIKLNLLKNLITIAYLRLQRYQWKVIIQEIQRFYFATLS